MKERSVKEGRIRMIVLRYLLVIYYVVNYQYMNLELEDNRYDCVAIEYFTIKEICLESRIMNRQKDLQ